jgi:HTH-type transcriptional regulator/antitoxin HipB
MGYIGDWIQQAREKKQWSQAELGRRLGQPQSSISRIEGGADVRLSTLTEMARVLDLEPMLVPKRLVPAVHALMQYAVEPEPGAEGYRPASPLVGEFPEDAEDA